MPVDLYYLDLSAPCRAVLLTARAVGVELNLKVVHLLEGAHMKPDFLAMNPEHTIPTMVDGDFTLWESRAICKYLVGQYGKDTALYPSEPRARATVDRLLYFDMGTLFHRMAQYVVPILFRGEKGEPQQVEKIEEALGWLDGYLAGHDWAAGDTLTVADHSLAATVATIKEIPIDMTKYNNILPWLERCKAEMPGYKELNEAGAVAWGQFFKSKKQ